jgi:hypothetical protein
MLLFLDGGVVTWRKALPGGLGRVVHAVTGSAPSPAQSLRPHPPNCPRTPTPAPRPHCPPSPPPTPTDSPNVPRSSFGVLPVLGVRGVGGPDRGLTWHCCFSSSSLASCVWLRVANAFPAICSVHRLFGSVRGRSTGALGGGGNRVLVACGSHTCSAKCVLPYLPYEGGVLLVLEVLRQDLC